MRLGPIEINKYSKGEMSILQ